MSPRTRNVNRLFAVAATTLVAALLPAGVSQASTAGTFLGTLYFNASPGADNNVSVSTSSGYLISDSAAPITAGSGCSQTTANSVTCTTGGVSDIRLDLDDGNDTTTVTANQNVEIHGGAGNDTLNGGSQGDQLYGEDGDDSLQGGGGPDLMDGGNGYDRVSYASRTNPVRVDQDGGWDDGEGGSPLTGEFDNVLPNVEDVTGGSGDDVFVGSADANVYHGGPGNDSMLGNGGDDQLFGDDGNDTVEGGTGTDTIDAGAGNDGVSSRDNGVLDHVQCGNDADSVTADREDDVAASCETVYLPSLTVITTPPAANPALASGPVRVVTIVERTLTISAKGKIPVKISCGADQKRDCKGTITITASALKKKKASASRRSGPAKGGKIVVAKGKFKVKRGRTALASVKASKKSLKKVVKKKSKRLNATLTVSMKNSDGSTTQILKPIALSTKNL